LLGTADGLLHTDGDVSTGDLVGTEDAGEAVGLTVSTLLGQVLATVNYLKEAPATTTTTTQP